MAKLKEEKTKKAEVFAPPAELVVELPAGTRAFQTFRITGTGPGLLSASCRGMIADGLLEMEREKWHRAHPNQVVAKEPKIVRLPEETSELATYPTNDNRFYHPAAAFIGSLVDGLWAAKAKFPGIREGANNILQRTVRICHEQAVLVDPKTFKPFTWGKKKDINNPPYIMDFRTAVNLNSGGRVMCWRALWKRWATFITLSFDASQIQSSVVLQALNLGGELVGVGGFRPLPPQNRPKDKRGKGGPFGTYEAAFWNKPIPKGAIPEL